MSKTVHLIKNEKHPHDVTLMNKSDLKILTKEMVLR